jgi:N-acetylglucosaminyldiphosphoundecaprenol N-acetyl-beta-D-mannosaminyltransferase
MSSESEGGQNREQREILIMGSVDFLGFKFPVQQLEAISQKVLRPGKSSGTAYHLVNAFTLAEASKSHQLTEILKNDLLLCDGKPLSVILKKQNSHLNQIRGADLMFRVLQGSPKEVGHFFLGSSDETLQKLMVVGNALNPNLSINGVLAPPYLSDFAHLIDAWVMTIKDSGASIVWVGLGTPKQDFVVHELSQRIPVDVFAVGAAFDYLAGNLSESPRVFQVVGLEWLFRLFKEPRRLAKRYLIGNLIFIQLVLKHTARALISSKL